MEEMMEVGKQLFEIDIASKRLINELKRENMNLKKELALLRSDYADLLIKLK